MDAEINTMIAALSPDRAGETHRLIALCGRISGFAPHLAGSGILGFGRYAYRYDSGHAGGAAVIAFAPRKAELALYPNCTLDAAGDVLAQLGRHRRGKGCVYLKRLDDADPAVLEALFRRGLAEVAARWPVTPS